MVDWAIIETKREDAESQAIYDAVVNLGINAEKFSLEQAYIHDIKPNCIVRGPIPITKDLTERKGAITWFDLSSPTCRKYYPAFGRFLFQTKYVMIPVGDLRRRWKDLCGYFGSNCLFIRPDANTKCFTGGVLDSHEVARLCQSYLDPDLLVVVAPPYTINAEYRLIYRNNTYLTGSRYILDGHLNPSPEIPDDILKFADKAVANKGELKMPPVWAIDIARSGEYLGVLEVSGSCCCGFYESDLSKIVKAITEEAEKFLLQNEDLVV